MLDSVRSKRSFSAVRDAWIARSVWSSSAVGFAWGVWYVVGDGAPTVSVSAGIGVAVVVAATAAVVRVRAPCNKLERPLIDDAYLPIGPMCAERESCADVNDGAAPPRSLLTYE